MKTRGFTMIELILVLILVGILAVAVIPRFFDRKSYDARAYYDQVLSILRFGQKTAIAQNRSVYVRLNGFSVGLCYDANCTSAVPPASGSNSGSTTTKAACLIGGAYQSSWACEAPPSGVTVGGASTFYFSPLGKPYMPTDAPPTSTFSQLAIAITGDVARTAYIESETGYVH